MCNLCNTNNVEGIEPHYSKIQTINGKPVWIQRETSEEDQDKIFSEYQSKLIKILGKKGNKVFFNHDPRGYTLKINEATAKEYSLYQDFGGYGIIAPDFTPNN